MSIEIATLVLTGISTLSSLVQAAKAAFDIGKDFSDGEIQEITDKSTVSEQAAEKLFSLIENKILEEILGNIDREKEKLLDAIKDASKTSAQKGRVMDEVDRNICFELGTIKRYNKGVLPDLDPPDLYEVWDQHNCR